jgi:hypothetical protein
MFTGEFRTHKQFDLTPFSYAQNTSTASTSRHSSFLPPNFLRPVIGTFSAEGIGRDTSDTSYKERAISLSRQQAMKEARGFTR